MTFGPKPQFPICVCCTAVMCSTPVIGLQHYSAGATDMNVDWTYWYVDVLEPGEYGVLIRRGPSWEWSGNGHDQDGAGCIGMSEWPNYDIQKEWLSLMRNGDCGGEQDAQGLFDGGWWLNRSSVGRFPEIGDNTGGTLYYKSGDGGRFDLYKILPRDKFQRIDYAKSMFGLLQKTKEAFTQIMQDFSFDAHGAAVAEKTPVHYAVQELWVLQNLFKQTLHWFESTMNKQIVRVKMLYQDARGKYLDLFVLPFEMPQAVPTDMPKTVDMKPRSGRNKKPKMEKDMKIMPKKEKVMKPMSKKGKFQEKSTRCRSRGAKNYKKAIHPRYRVTYKRPSALERATEVPALSVEAID